MAAAAPHSAMLFRWGMRHELERVGCLDDARLIYSLWTGYLDGSLENWAASHGIPFDLCHTSGHAPVADLLALRQKFSPAPVVPIHSSHPDQFEALFGNSQPHPDGEWWDVLPIKSP